MRPHSITRIISGVNIESLKSHCRWNKKRLFLKQYQKTSWNSCFQKALRSPSAAFRTGQRYTRKYVLLWTWPSLTGLLWIIELGTRFLQDRQGQPIRFRYSGGVFHKHGLARTETRTDTDIDTDWHGQKHGQALRAAIGCSQETPADLFYELLYLFDVHSYRRNTK